MKRFIFIQLVILAVFSLLVEIVAIIMAIIDIISHKPLTPEYALYVGIPMAFAYLFLSIAKLLNK